MSRALRTARGPVAAFALLTAATAWAGPKDDARRHYLEGVAAAEKGDFQRALDEFLIAQEIYPHPASIYNIARAYGDLGDLEASLRYYRLYMAAAPPDRAAEAAPIVAVLEARLRAQEPAPTPGPAAPGGAVAPAELARLEQIAAELQALAGALAARAPSGDAAAPPADGAGAAPVADPAPGPGAPAAEGPGYADDAYRRTVVSASRYGQDPMDSPSTVTVLTEDDIRLSGATNIPDILRQVAGVDVMQLSAAQPDVSIRGFNRELSNKVLVLIDGRSVYHDMLAAPFWGTLPISLQEIERIEVIRGPGSAMYGANAMTGVVNIITRTPGEGDSLLHLEAGQPGYVQGTALVTGRQGPSAWRLSAGHHQTGRWSADALPGPESAVQPFVDDPSTSLTATRAHGRVDRQLGDAAWMSLSGGYAAGMTEFYAFGALGDYALPFRAGHARLDVSAGPVLLRGFYNTLDADAGQWLEPEGGRTLDNTVSNDVIDVEVEGRASVRTGAVQHRLIGGVGYRGKWVEWTYLEGGGEPIEEHHARIFVHDEASVGPVSLVGSLRLDRHPLVPLAETVSPRGAVVWRVAEQTRLRLNAGTSFRAPSQMESYLDLNQPASVDGVFVRTRGDQDLAPERIFTVEAGLHDASTPVHRLDVALYYNRVTDLIFVGDIVPERSAFDPAEAGFAVGTTTFTNLAPVYDGVGGEADLRLFPIDGLEVYTNAAVQRTFETVDGQTVPEGSASVFKGNLGVLGRLPGRVDLSGHVHYVSAQTWLLRDYNAEGDLIADAGPIPGRTLLVARGAWRPDKDERVELSATAWNVLALISGEGVREHPEGQLVAGRLFGALTWRF